MNRPLNLRLAVVGALAISFAMSACGRKGGLDLPPRSSSEPVSTQQSVQPQQQAEVFDEYGNPSTPKGQKKSFFLDWLLN